MYKALWFTYRDQLFFRNNHDWFHIPFSELTSSDFTVTVHKLDLCFNFSLTRLYLNRHSIPTSITICKEKWRWLKTDANIYSLFTKWPTNILKKSQKCVYMFVLSHVHLLNTYWKNDVRDKHSNESAPISVDCTLDIIRACNSSRTIANHVSATFQLKRK